MPKYLSGRVKRTPQDKLTEDRYLYLGLDQAEPNLGDPPEVDAIPSGTQYQIVSVTSRPGERFWKEIGGGTIPAAHTVRDEGVVVPKNALFPNGNPNPNAGINSITDVNFAGLGITVTGTLDQNGFPGTGVTVTVFAPGNNHQVLFNDDGEFATSSFFTFDNTVGIESVGIGTNLRVQGDLKLDRTIYGEDNQPGVQGDLLVKTATGGMKWQNQNAVRSGAGGTITEIQFHDSTGLLGGANNFVFDYTNERVGIGSTQPDRLLDVLGNSRFVGFTTFTDDVTFTTANAENILFDKDDNSLKFGDDVKLKFGDTDGLEIYHSETLAGTNDSYIDSSARNLYIRLNTGTDNGGNIALQPKINEHGVLIEDDGPVKLYYDGGSSSTDGLKLETTGYGVTIFGITETQFLNVTGVSTFEGLVEFGTNSDLIKKTGDLEIDADRLVIQDAGSNYTGAIFESNGNVKLNSTGNQKFQTTGVGVSVTGLTTTTHLSVTGFVTSHLIPGEDSKYDLGSQNNAWRTIYADTIIGVDDEEFQQLNVTGILTTKDLHVSGISSFVGVATFHSDIDVDGYADFDDVDVSGIVTTKNLDVTGVSTFVGIATFGDIEVGVLTVRDKLHVSGISSFAGITTFYDDIIVGTSATVGFGSTAYFQHDVEFHGASGIASITFDKSDNELEFGENVKLKFGDSLEIYYGQSPYNQSTTDKHGYIRDTGSGDLVVLSNQFSIRNAGETKDMARFYENDRVELRYNNDLVFQTTGVGVSVTGLTSTTNLSVTDSVTSNLIPNTDQGFDIGSDPNSGGKSWGKVYAEEFIGKISTQQDNLVIENLKVNGISTFIGIATFGGGIHVQSGVTTVGFLTAVNDIFVAGVVTATDFNSASDAKLKTNIQVIDNPIEKIMKIDGVSFNWKASNKPSFGVIADNVQETLPDLVNDEDPKTVNYNGLVGLLIEVVKNQQEQINELRSLLDK